MSPYLEAGIKVLGMVLYMLFEKWLGSTDKVKANSLIDLIVQALSKLKK